MHRKGRKKKGHHLTNYLFVHTERHLQINQLSAYRRTLFCCIYMRLRKSDVDCVSWKSASEYWAHATSTWSLADRVRWVRRRLKGPWRALLPRARACLPSRRIHKSHSGIPCTYNTGYHFFYYLLLILFTSRCQFEWQVAEHFRVCLLASTWACQGLTGIHSVCRIEAAPRWFAAVCLSWKCSASTGQQRGGLEGVESVVVVGGSSWTSPSLASRGFYTISSKKWKCHGSVHLSNNWNLGQRFIY